MPPVPSCPSLFDPSLGRLLEASGLPVTGTRNIGGFQEFLFGSCRGGAGRIGLELDPVTSASLWGDLQAQTLAIHDDVGMPDWFAHRFEF